MHVLIADFDLFRQVGGGQTVYRRLVETNPDIDFHYLIRKEPLEAPRPANAHPVSYREAYQQDHLFRRFLDITPPPDTHADFIEAANIACSVQGRHFDIIESPDYTTRGFLLRPALRHHGVSADRFVLAMHGTCSVSEYLNWQTLGQQRIESGAREQWQYLQSDIRYSLSRDYLEEWHGLTGFAPRYLHPFRFLRLPQVAPMPEGAEPPSLCFMGRTERRKGPDIFLDLATWLPRDSYNRASLIGPDDGFGSTQFLRDMIANRGLDVDIRTNLLQPDLEDIFRARTLTLLPSRWDTFNLLALESLLMGCPTVLGTGAGAVRFLREECPELPFTALDVAHPRRAFPVIRNVLEGYDRHREALLLALAQPRRPASGDTLREIYEAEPQSDFSMEAHHQQIFDQLMRLHESHHASALSFAQPQPDAAGVSAIRREPNPEEAVRLQAADKVLGALQSLPGAALHQARLARRLWDRAPEFQFAPEATEAQFSFKLQALWQVAEQSQVDRVRWWHEIARMERLRGNDLIAATYALRIIRLLDADPFQELAFACRTLEENGFPREAEVAQILFGRQDQRDSRGRAYLDAAYARHRENPERPFALVEGHGTRTAYRVSVIVSLYRAAAKLPTFLRLLQDQTLVKTRQAEVILVETGSPAGDHEVFRSLLPELEMDITYARVETRETIQSAWNRGIALSQGTYLSFLGVDESLRPDALERLAAALDADPNVDWVQANSLITDVDMEGAWIRDVMRYDRTNYHQDLVYLETCYLSWVGALYRKSIHERFGYYDDTFRAAGDTEFKGRILPHLRSAALPETLGFFLNYPDERTTQSPTAELEDLRAWYLHRSPAGVGYAFDERPVEEAEAQFRHALRYRKSFLKHFSTDFDYAVNVGEYVLTRKPQASLRDLVTGARDLRDAYRALDFAPNLTEVTVPLEFLTTLHRAARTAEHHDRIMPDTGPREYAIFNDNRYEQHQGVWRSDPSVFPSRCEQPFAPRYRWPRGPEGCERPRCTFALLTSVAESCEGLEATLASVAAQRGERVTHVVVDRGLHPVTPTTLRAQPNVVWAHLPGVSVAQALDHAASLAPGDVLAWLEPGETLLPGTLHHVADALGPTRPWQIAFGSGIVLDAEARELWHQQPIPDLSLDRLLRWWDGAAELVVPACFFTREAFETVGGFSASGDAPTAYHLWLRLRAQHAFLALNRPLATLRLTTAAVDELQPKVEACWRAVLPHVERLAPPARVRFWQDYFLHRLRDEPEPGGTRLEPTPEAARGLALALESVRASADSWVLLFPDEAERAEARRMLEAGSPSLCPDNAPARG